jgi:hypothetical protein
MKAGNISENCYSDYFMFYNNMLKTHETLINPCIKLEFLQNCDNTYNLTKCMTPDILSFNINENESIINLIEIKTTFIDTPVKIKKEWYLQILYYYVHLKEQFKFDVIIPQLIIIEPKKNFLITKYRFDDSLFVQNLSINKYMFCPSIFMKNNFSPMSLNSVNNITHGIKSKLIDVNNALVDPNLFNVYQNYYYHILNFLESVDQMHEIGLVTDSSEIMKSMLEKQRLQNSICPFDHMKNDNEDNGVDLTQSIC